MHHDLKAFNPRLPCMQPSGKFLQQADHRRFHHGHLFCPRWKFAALCKCIGRSDPGARIGRPPKGGIEQVQKRPAKSACQACTRQVLQLAKCANAHTIQERGVCLQLRNVGQRKCMQCGRKGLFVDDGVVVAVCGIAGVGHGGHLPGSGQCGPQGGPRCGGGNGGDAIGGLPAKRLPRLVYTAQQMIQPTPQP